MVTQSLSFETGDLSPAFVGSQTRLVTKEQVCADDYPIERYVACENPKRPFLWANDSDSKRVLIVRPDCKLWSCPACAQRNRRRWAVRIYQGITEYSADGRSWWLATITLPSGKRNLGRQVDIWRDGWPRLYYRMKRHTSKSGVGELHYVLCPELAPETGRMHAHMLVNDSLGAVLTKSKKTPYRSDFLKDAGAECGLGYMNDIRPLDDAKIGSWYISKYVGKSLGVDNWPEYLRRVRVSNGWPELKHEESIGANLSWNIANERKIYEIVQHFWGVGFDAINLNTGELVEIVDLPGDVQ